jgi:hypothetical protein
MVCVYSKQTQASAEIVSGMVDESTVVIPIEVEGNNFTEILYALQYKIILTEYDHLTTNVTGGTKIMALALYEYALKAQNICQVYQCYIGLDQTIHWFTENRIDAFTEKLTIEEFIQLSGQKLLSKDLYPDILDRFSEPLHTVKSYLDSFAKSTIWDKFLKNVVAKLRNQNNHYESTRQSLQRLLTNGSLGGFDICWNAKGILIEHQDKVFIDMTQSDQDITWFLFNAGWFELLTAQKFALHYSPEDIYMNVKFPVLANMEREKNEVDILVNDGGKLIFVECKSGNVKSEHINNIQVRKETYGGVIGSSILVTRYALDKSKNEKDKIIVEKCKEMNINYKTLKEI